LRIIAGQEKSFNGELVFGAGYSVGLLNQEPQLDESKTVKEIVHSHDRWFLDRIATHILVFEGNSEVTFFEGSFSEYEENRKKRMGNEAPKRVKYKKLMS
jgi:ATPase subunit of ABC transporter with duplicated ATPase domains